MSAQKRHTKECTRFLKPGLAPTNDENRPPQSNPSKPISKSGLVGSNDVVHNGSPSVKPLNVQKQQQQQQHSQKHTPRPSTKRLTAPEPSNIPAIALEGTSARQRKAISMEVKRNIARWLKAEPNVPMKKICEGLGVERGVVQRVAKEMDEHLNWSGKSDSCRLKKPRLPLVDILVAASFKGPEFCTRELRNCDISMRATEIRGTLSTLVLNPPGRCTFNANWTQKFKESRSQLESRCIHTSNHPWKSGGVGNEPWVLAALLDQYALGDIYSVFLNGDFKTVTLGTPSWCEIQREIRVAAMLSCNGLGENKEVSFARVNRDTFVPTTGEEIKCVRFDNTQDLDNATFESWLLKLDAQADRNVLVIIDRDTWKLLNIDEGSKTLQKLRLVTVMAIGNLYREFLPEKCSVIRDLGHATALVSGAEAQMSHDNILSSLSQEWLQVNVGFEFKSCLTLAGRSGCLEGCECTCLSDKDSESIPSCFEPI
ncbi:hypothetical protein BGX26_004053 [Mortierella sp. AD094]|nr:hypothetical protein BGX26_004053 [Mortierella sp. AD094]